MKDFIDGIIVATFTFIGKACINIAALFSYLIFAVVVIGGIAGLYYLGKVIFT